MEKNNHHRNDIAKEFHKVKIFDKNNRLIHGDTIQKI